MEDTFFVKYLKALDGDVIDGNGKVRGKVLQVREEHFSLKNVSILIINAVL